MKFIQKLLISLTVITVGFGLIACSSSTSSENLSGTCEELLNRLYESIPED